MKGFNWGGPWVLNRHVPVGGMIRILRVAIASHRHCVVLVVFIQHMALIQVEQIGEYRSLEENHEN